MSDKKLLKVSIPEGVDFADLRLERNPRTGAIKFDWAPLERICAASGIDIAVLRDGPEDNVAGLIVAWYAEHIARGGARDPVEDELIAEALAEDERGGGLSYPPGSA